MSKTDYIKNIISAYKNLNLFVRFALNGIFIFALWQIFYGIFRDKNFVDFIYEEVVYRLTNIQLAVTKFLLETFGYKTEVYGKVIKSFLGGTLHVDRGCLGRNPQGLFIGFILAYPGNFKNKLWYIPAGLVVISILNIFRIIGLLITINYYPQYIDINHHYIFKIIVYFFIFLMWIIWIQKFNKKNRLFHKKENVNKEAENIIEKSDK